MQAKRISDGCAAGWFRARAELQKILMGDENLADKVGGFAADATVDTFADTGINNVLDAVASHIPGGGAVEGVLKTGVDLAANNAINAELGKFGGMFGQHAAEPAADADTPAS